ncbi:hypothetical protein CONCODRAFT_70329 [Conidiobolus coronatus NRRL 28638]|uniref:SCP domain-containing protein n=1 Tax=Conidiobolus coronatus (strain ATCC 28846 / CBS 209.66 / NRRL 28638) TaxID=796925 RepID=A0A137P7B0_CONC2|nr:hypothetical protein CONCODRAFT_70329 [Conidiobolus coronatus NRRL 28638]|eukprot:KXN70849.1 hypothetical protein CONCODRAFT_70329 [Conidiobolus coronatus NRRL 28638]
MKVQSIISFFALYLVSGLNAQAQNGRIDYQGGVNPDIYSDRVPSRRVGMQSNQQTQVQQQNRSAGNMRTQISSQPAGQSTYNQRPGANSQQQNRSVRNMRTQIASQPSGQTTYNQRPGVNSQQQNRSAGNTRSQVGTQSTRQTTSNQRPSINSRQQSQSPSSNKSRGVQNRNGQKQGGKLSLTKGSGPITSCANVRNTPTMNIKKVLYVLNQVRGDLPPLKLNSALVKASVIKSSNKAYENKAGSNAQTAKNSQSSTSKQCGYKGGPVIQFTTAAKGEDDLLVKFMSAKDNILKLKNTKFKAFGAAKVDKQWTLSLGA